MSGRIERITIYEERSSSAGGASRHDDRSSALRPSLPWRVKLSIALGAAFALALIVALFVIAIPVAIALLALAVVAAVVRSARDWLRSARHVDAQGRRNVRVMER